MSGLNSWCNEVEPMILVKTRIMIFRLRLFIGQYILLSSSHYLIPTTWGSQPPPGMIDQPKSKFPPLQFSMVAHQDWISHYQGLNNTPTSPTTSLGISVLWAPKTYTKHIALRPFGFPDLSLQWHQPPHVPSLAIPKPYCKKQLEFWVITLSIGHLHACTWLPWHIVTCRAQYIPPVVHTWVYTSSYTRPNQGQPPYTEIYTLCLK